MIDEKIYGEKKTRPLIAKHMPNGAKIMRMCCLQPAIWRINKRLAMPYKGTWK
jgi:hypothetical protein